MKKTKQRQTNRTNCPICGKPVRETDARTNPIEMDYQDCHMECFYSKDKDKKKE